MVDLPVDRLILSMRDQKERALPRLACTAHTQSTSMSHRVRTVDCQSALSRLPSNLTNTKMVAVWTGDKQTSCGFTGGRWD
jgi:hypothetical protein